MPGILRAGFARLQQHRRLHIEPWQHLSQDSRFVGASLAIVGNAGYLTELEQGSWIDCHDLVLRMNNFAIDGYEAHVGKRLDLYLTSFFTDVWLDNPLLRKASWVISSVPNNFRKRPLNSRHGQLITEGALKMGRSRVFVPPQDEFLEKRTLLGAYPTSGAMAIILAVEHLLPVCERIFLTGFSFFEGRSHYFSDQTIVPVNHNPRTEREYIARLVYPHWLAGRVEVDPLLANALDFPVTRQPKLRRFDRASYFGPRRRVGFQPARAIYNDE